MMKTSDLTPDAKKTQSHIILRPSTLYKGTVDDDDDDDFTPLTFIGNFLMGDARFPSLTFSC